jgi:pimeloyl-ACP methyl ester carboxylesterase
VELDFGRVYVRDTGPGPTESVDVPPLVMLHDLLVTQHEFRHVIPELSATRRVLAVDLPGCGESDRPSPSGVEGYALTWLAASVRKLVGALGIDHADVLGHGLGGMIALCLAEEEMRLVRRLVLLDTACVTTPPLLGGRLPLQVGVGLPLLKTLFRRADLRRHLAGALSTPELLEEDAVDLYWDRLARRGGLEATCAILSQMQNLDHMRARLGDIRCKTMAIWGDRDRLIPLDAVEQMVDLLPDAALRIIDGCGHAPNEERPDALVELVLEHLGG